LTLTVITSFWPVRSFAGGSGRVSCALKPLLGSGAAIREIGVALEAGDPVVAGFGLQPIANVRHPAASKTIPNFINNYSSLFGSIDFSL
jgi:hypothetical protein